MQRVLQRTPQPREARVPHQVAAGAQLAPCSERGKGRGRRRRGRGRGRGGDRRGDRREEEERGEGVEKREELKGLCRL